MEHHLIYKDENSNKFWQIVVTDTTYTVTYGKADTKGTSKTKTFATASDCLENAKKQLQSKLKKGYLVKDIPTLATPSKAVSKTATVPQKEKASVVTVVEKMPEEIAFPKTTLDSYLQAIKAHIVVNELITASDLCTEAYTLSLSTEDEQKVHQLSGEIALLKNDLESAEEILTKAGKEGYVLLAEVFVQKKDYPTAFSYYKQANTYEAYKSAGNIAKEKGQFKSYIAEAIFYFEQAITIGESQQEASLWECYLKLGAMFHQQGDERAEEYYKKSIASTPTDDRPYNNLAVLYISQNKYKEAQTVLEEGIAHFPEATGTYYNMACLYGLQANKEKAIYWLEEALVRGYSNDRQIHSDQDFDSLRSDQTFKDLIVKCDYYKRSISDVDDLEEGDLHLVKEFRLYSYDLRNPKVKDFLLVIDKLKNLEVLKLEGIKAFPKGITQLKKLKRLSLMDTSIKELPTAVGNMDLEDVELELKRIKTFPSYLENVKGLKKLHLSSVKFAEIPKSIAHFKKLDTLLIKHTKLDKVHPEIGSLSQLINLEIRDTAVTALPDTLGELRNLMTLIVEENPKLTHLPEEIFMLPKLNHVSFRKNGFPSTEAEKIFDEGKKNETPKRLLAIFLAILQDNRKYLEEQAKPRDIIQALNSSVRMLRSKALLLLSEERVTTSIDAKVEVLVLGKFDKSVNDLKKEVKALGATVAKKGSTTNSHVLIGEKPGNEIMSLLERNVIWLTETQLMPPLESDSVATVSLTPMLERQIRTLLLSSEEMNLDMGLELLSITQAIALMELELFVAYQFAENKNHKKIILSLVKNAGSPELQKALSKKYGFKNGPSNKKMNEYIVQISAAAGFDENQFAYAIFRRTKDSAYSYLLTHGTSEQRKEVLEKMIVNNSLKLDYDIAIKELPTEIIEFKGLKELDITSIKPKKFPSYITDLQHLEDLNIGWSGIKALPKEMSSLTKLKKLNISACPFKEFPIVVTNLKNLEELIHTGHSEKPTCCLTEIPEDIAKLSSLKNLNLSDNKITQFPSGFFELNALEVLDISSNTSIQALPETISQLEHLEWLNLSGLALTSLPKGLTKLKQLSYLNISNSYSNRAANPFTAFPEVLFELTKLEILVIDVQQLERFQEELSKMTILKTLKVVGGAYRPDEWKSQWKAILPNIQLDFVW